MCVNSSRQGTERERAAGGHANTRMEGFPGLCRELQLSPITIDPKPSLMERSKFEPYMIRCKGQKIRSMYLDGLTKRSVWHP